MDSLIDSARQKVRLWTAAHQHAILYDDENSTLLDVASQKRLKLSWRAVTAFEEKIHPETGDPYLVLLFDSGKQIALADPAGIAFAPSVENSGPVPNLPPVVCLRDYFTLRQRIDHHLYDHPDEAPPHECLDLIMSCIAILDGGRAVGLAVGDLEGELEKSLNELEKRTG